ncbi:hypothetical protein [Streptomyces sp. NPDC007088]|uniref:hypothetical protein n=1 Tax=Streptomyces sp. NPDC007088 TaxID=3364773 RepID=UPI0036A76423
MTHTPGTSGTSGPPDAAGGAPGRPTVHIGSVDNSAVGIGDHNVVSHVRGRGPAPDPAQAELLAAVRALREDLGRFVATSQNEALDAELSATEGEIDTAGAAAPGRLARLRQALDLAGPLAASLASGAAVAQSLAALLGG